ncbi:hypothetical protein ABT294_17505 [Nonomuraea sp. NPDC000554]|uniref:hypothetical protein n=1 Tax=Nonomuraea sp. NPDC000554 TaxID=3154259 RepID=UPI003332FE6E
MTFRCGAHEHLEFGDGEIDFPPVLHALADSGNAPVLLCSDPSAARDRFEAVEIKDLLLRLTPSAHKGDHYVRTHP